MKNFILSLVLLLLSSSIRAQIGYQVSLLNSATGEPRANEQVTCHVELTDKDETVVWSQDINSTSNEFGVISLTVGNSSMFKDFKFAERLPLYISVKVGDVLIGKSQILNVPIAEYAKYTGVLTPDVLCDNNLNIQLIVERGSLTFSNDGKCYYLEDSNRSEGYWTEGHLNYTIDGNDLIISGEVTIHTFKDGIGYSDYGIPYSYNTKILWIGTYYPTLHLLLIDRGFNPEPQDPNK